MHYIKTTGEKKNQLQKKQVKCIINVYFFRSNF